MVSLMFKGGLRWLIWEHVDTTNFVMTVLVVYYFISSSGPFSSGDYYCIILSHPCSCLSGDYYCIILSHPLDLARTEFTGYVWFGFIWKYIGFKEEQWIIYTCFLGFFLLH